MHLSNMGCAVLATALILALGSTPARAQNEAAPASQPALNFDPSPPAPAAALDMFDAVADWLRRWQTPMDPTGQKPVHAAAVTLRYEGSIVGRGAAISPEPSGAPGILMLAAARAMNEARTRLPVPHDALMDDNLRAMAPMIAITVEIAGRPVPITFKEWPDAIKEVGPGLDGVAVRMGERMEAMFPETMIVTGTDAAGALASLVSKVSGDPTMGLKKPAELREKDGVAFYRLKTVQIAHTKQGGAPTLLQRCGRLEPFSTMTEAGLRRWADLLALHLVSACGQRGADQSPLPESLNPVQGTSGPGSSPGFDGALVSFALSGYSKITAATEIAARAQEAAYTVLHRVSNEYPDGAVSDPPVAALFIACGRGRVAFPDGANEPLGLVKAMTASSPATLLRFAKDMEGEIHTLPPAAEGAATFGYVQLDAAVAPAESKQTIVARVLSRTPPGELVGQMPWLGWAAVLAFEGGPGHEAGAIPAAPALREMRVQLWQHQLTPENLSADARDLAGGIVFTTSRQPLPTWQSARPLAFIGAMLGDPRFTDDNEVDTELIHLLASLRFLRQLTADEAECHMYKDPAKAIGGVRNSLFDQRMPPEAAAMTLLAVCETLKSLDAIKARQAGGK